MKKLLFVTLLSFSAHNAHAATLKHVKNLSDVGLEEFSSDMKTIAGTLVNGDTTELVIAKYTISKRSGSEPWINTLKQAIYQTRGSDRFAHPEEVTVKSLSKTYDNYEKAVTYAMSYAEHGSDFSDLVGDLSSSLDVGVSAKQKMKLFTVYDYGEILGECKSLAVVDQAAEEILIVSTCYGE